MNTIALYAGSFNPFHIGHLNILEKITEIFGKENVIIAQGINPEKPPSSYSIHKVEALKEYLTIDYKVFLHDLIDKLEEKGDKIVLIRGLRNGHDLDAESNQLEYIKSFKKDIRVIYIPCDKEYEHISSTGIRNLNNFKQGSGDKYIVK